MRRLTANITFEGAKKWVFDKVVSVEIARDIDTLTDMCTITIPRKIKWQGEESIPIRRGDKVSVELGYDDDLELAFSGYVTTIGLKSPIVITCEDYMFKLKAIQAAKKAYKSATLDQILKDQPLGIKHKVFGAQNIGQYRVTADTISGLLGHLKDQGGVRSFVRMEAGEPVLYCGVLFDRGKGVNQVFATGLNIIDDKQLKVQSAEDVKIKVKAISLMPDNSRERQEVGDSDGETRTLHTFNRKGAELKSWAEQELKRLKRDGLAGSFITFGGNLLAPLDNIGIKIDGHRKGVYQVDKNIIKYSSGGFRQEITIGARVAE